MQRLIVNDPVQRMSIREARRHPWIAGVVNNPPEGFESSQQSSYDQSQSQRMGPVEDDDDDDDEQGGSYTRAATEPPVVANDGAGPGATGFDAHRLHNNLSAMSDDNSGANLSAGAFGSPQNADPVVTSTADGMADLNLETETVHGGHDTDNGGSFVHTSVGTPPTNKGSAMDVDGEEAWHHVQAPVVHNRAVTPSSRARATITARASTKRKAQAIDFDSSDLSTPPPLSADEYATSGPPTSKGLKAKAPRTTATPAGRTTKATRPSTAPESTGATKSSQKRRARPGFRAPESSDEEDGAPIAGPSARKAIPSVKSPAAPTRRSSRHMPVKVQKLR